MEIFQLEDPVQSVESVLQEEHIDDIISDHLRACYEVSNQRYIEAYDHQVSLGENHMISELKFVVKALSFSVQTFCKLLSSQKDDNWPLPMMHVICLDLRLIASKADVQMVKKGAKPGATLEKAAEHMMACFRTCALDSKSSEEVTKRWGMTEQFIVIHQAPTLELKHVFLLFLERSTIVALFCCLEQMCTMCETNDHLVGQGLMGHLQTHIKTFCT